MKNLNNTIIKNAEQYAQELRLRIAQLENKLKSLPDGSLTFSKRNNGLQYYYRSPEDKRFRYFSAKNEDLLHALANKYYICKTLLKLKKNLKGAERLIATHSGLEEFDLYNRMPKQMQEINANLYTSKEQRISSWQSRPYIRNPFKPESLIHDTMRGEKVRSKSEVMITNGVYNHGLAYFLEYPLKLNNYTTIYPDLLILHPTTFEEIYWEHFGMMDDPEYAADAVRRIMLLDNAGIKLGKNLICTFETIKTPLSSTLVESYINLFFFQ